MQVIAAMSTPQKTLFPKNGQRHFQLNADTLSRPASLVLVLLSGLLWSVGGVLIRLVEDASGWQIIFYRSVTQTLVLLIAMTFIGTGSLPGRFLGIGRYGAAASFFLALAFIAFVFSILATDVANTLLILATVPFISALLGFVLLREKPSRSTIAGAVVATTGVAIMVGEGFSAGFVQGDLIAIFGAFCFASYIVFMRGGRATDMLPANAVAGIASAIAAALLMGSSSISWYDFSLCIALGVFQTGLGLVTFTLGSKQLKASELALLSLIHVILGPVWVLLLVGEIPATNVVIGGAVVLGAISVPAALQLRRQGQ